MRGRQHRHKMEGQYPVMKVILKCVLISLKVVFHFISIQGDGRKILGHPWGNRIPWGGVNLSFPGLELVLSGVFQAI